MDINYSQERLGDEYCNISGLLSKNITFNRKIETAEIQGQYGPSSPP